MKKKESFFLFHDPLVLCTGGATPMLKRPSLFEHCVTRLVGSWSVASKQSIRGVDGHVRNLTSSYFEPRVHKNKSMQHHTLGSGTAEFQVT